MENFLKKKESEIEKSVADAILASLAKAKEEKNENEGLSNII